MERLRGKAPTIRIDRQAKPVRANDRRGVGGEVRPSTMARLRLQDDGIFISAVVQCEAGYAPFFLDDLLPINVLLLLLLLFSFRRTISPLELPMSLPPYARKSHSILFL